MLSERTKLKCSFVPGIISFLNVVRVIVEALLGSGAFGVSPLALPWGTGAHYMQPVGQRGMGGGGTLVRKSNKQHFFCFKKKVPLC